MTYYEKEERQVSRAEKIQQAKSAFTHGTSPSRGITSGYGRQEMSGGFNESRRDTVPLRYGITSGSEENLNMEEGRHHFGMLRMVTAGVLFFVLLLAFHFGVSYKGYDRAYVEQVLSDNSHWESLVNQVTQVMSQSVK